MIIPTKTRLHSDRGFQCTSHDFKDCIEKHQITQSMPSLSFVIYNSAM